MPAYFINVPDRVRENEGHGPTLIRGYKQALAEHADFIFQTDSDGQTNPNEFESFWEKRHDYDAVFGVYYHDRVTFIPISFAPRTQGKNSINMKKIFRIGRNALKDFRDFKHAM